MLSGTQKGEVLIPLLRAALFDPRFKSFDIRVRGFEVRKPDGWFHPSTHPLWTPRQLFLYLVFADRLIPEPFDPVGTMAVTQGQFWHSFIGKVGMEAGVLKAVDIPVQCVETGARGEMDGRLDDEAYEFKTMRPSKAQKIPDLAVDSPEMVGWLMEKQPDYYAQVQEYLRLSGYERCRLLVLSMEYPFDMREILVRRDDAVIQGIAEKYRAVRQAVADQRLPIPCCAPQSKIAKACPVRMSCEIGLA